MLKCVKRTLLFTDVEMCNTVHTELPYKEPDFSKVESLCKLPDSLEDTERDKLVDLPRENLDLFVTDDNPELAFTRVVKHKMLLKPDVVGEHPCWSKALSLPSVKQKIYSFQFR